MSEAIKETLRLTIEGVHNCKATYKEKTHVRELGKGKLIWEGDVYIFDVEGIPHVDTAYAWSSPENNQVYAVLKAEAVHSEHDAIRIALAMD